MGATLLAEQRDRRLLARAKLGGGLERLAREQPDIDWTFDTEETTAAEERIGLAFERYVSGEGQLSELRNAFDNYRIAQTDKVRVRSLFN